MSLLYNTGLPLQYRTLCQILPEIQTATLILKLLDPSPIRDKDEWRPQSSSTHYAIGLVSDCPKVTVHAGKSFKTLIESGAALSLACTSV